MAGRVGEKRGRPSDTPRVVRAMPVALVVELPRRHCRRELVNQTIPLLRPGNPAHVSRIGDSAALVEWADGTVSQTEDTEGLDAEMRVRTRHFMRLAPSGDEPICRDAELFHSRACDNFAPSRPTLALAGRTLRQVCAMQLDRHRWWQGYLRTSEVPAAHGVALRGIDVLKDAARLRIFKARVVPADERSPWHYQLAGAPQAGDDAPDVSRRVGPAVAFFVGRTEAPHDARFVTAEELAATLNSSHRQGADVEHVRVAARREAIACLRFLVASRVAVLAELLSLRQHSSGDFEASRRGIELFQWYHQHGSPAELVASLSAVGFLAEGVTEASLVAEGASECAMSGEPIDAPRAAADVLAATGQQRRFLKAPQLKQAWLVVQQLGRTATLDEIALRQ